MTAYAVIRNGPTGKPYNMQNSKEFAAWEAEWAAHLAQTAPAPIKVERETRPGTNEPVDPVRKAAYAEAVAFIRDYTGTFGFILDLRARPAWGTVYYRLSDAQIAAVLKCKRMDEERAARVPVDRPAVTVAEQGWYDVDGTIYKVQIAVHGSGKPYAKQLIIDGPGEAHWEYVPGMITRLRPEQHLSVEAAAKYGTLYGVCVVCGATLTDEGSIARGIGPICTGRL